ncbi:DNA (cytosine-5-)-methyltransferase, partial [Dysosmobacter welbionis]
TDTPSPSRRDRRSCSPASGPAGHPGRRSAFWAGPVSESRCLLPSSAPPLRRPAEPVVYLTPGSAPVL